MAVVCESIASTVGACGHRVVLARCRTSFASNWKCGYLGSSGVRAVSAVASRPSTPRLARRSSSDRSYSSIFQLHTNILQSRYTTKSTFGNHAVGSTRRLHVAAAATDEPVGPLPERVLVIGKVWPERSSSAAGVRTGDLVRHIWAFVRPMFALVVTDRCEVQVNAFQRCGATVSYASAARQNEHSAMLEESGVAIYSCPLNRQQDFKELMATVQPDVCIFDRFTLEEMVRTSSIMVRNLPKPTIMHARARTSAVHCSRRTGVVQFGFMVQKLSPSTLRVLDTQDLHSLRDARHEVIKAGGDIQAAVSVVPTASSTMLLRELAAIHRSDLVLVVSPYERDLLIREYGIPPHKVTASVLCQCQNGRDDDFCYSERRTNGANADGIGNVVSRTCPMESVCGVLVTSDGNLDPTWTQIGSNLDRSAASWSTV
eukprot:1180578-Prorocentrum_minimum.AAC.1